MRAEQQHNKGSVLQAVAIPRKPRPLPGEAATLLDTSAKQSGPSKLGYTQTLQLPAQLLQNNLTIRRDCAKQSEDA